MNRAHRTRRDARVNVIALAALALRTSMLAAQSTTTVAPAPPADRDRDIVIGGAAGIVAASAIDRPLTLAFRSPVMQQSRAARTTATTFRLLAEPGGLIAGPAIYLVGRLNGSSRADELGLRMTETTVIAGIVTGVIKGVVGRARPLTVHDSSATVFRPGHGFTESEYASFPSGHTTVAFAAAASASIELHRLWPHTSRVVSPALYTAATLGGLSRIYDDDHWLSDVVAGAAVGILTSRATVRFNVHHPKNAVDHALLPSARVDVPLVRIKW